MIEKINRQISKIEKEKEELEFKEKDGGKFRQR
jgi:hypothetical protein